MIRLSDTVSGFSVFEIFPLLLSSSKFHFGVDLLPFLFLFPFVQSLFWGNNGSGRLVVLKAELRRTPTVTLIAWEWKRWKNVTGSLLITCTIYENQTMLLSNKNQHMLCSWSGWMNRNTRKTWHIDRDLEEFCLCILSSSDCSTAHAWLGRISADDAFVRFRWILSVTSTQEYFMDKLEIKMIIVVKKKQRKLCLSIRRCWRSFLKACMVVLGMRSMLVSWKQIAY